MALAVLAVVTAVAVAMAARRELRPPRWRAGALLAAGAALAGTGGYLVGAGPGVVLEVAGCALMVTFCGVNWRHPGLILVAAGLAANMTVIALNGGMPVKGLPPALGAGHHHHGISGGDRLSPLADQIRLDPLGEVLSPGDVVAAAGAAVAVFSLFAPGGAGRRRPARS